MTAKLLLFLAVLKLTSSDPMPEPEPNVNVHVGVNVNDNNNGKGGLSCVFGDTCYPDGCIIEGTCLKLKCCNGHWKCLGPDPRPECGKCLLHGDPHVIPYESNIVPYTSLQIGDFAITQPDFSNPALFGVNAKFQQCGTSTGISCVHSITYYEPGITVTLTLPPWHILQTYCVYNSTNANEPNCSITLEVNGDIYPTPDCEADSFSGTSGSALVFQHNHIGGFSNLYCIAIVGSKGLSMALCQYHKDWPWFHVFAMPSLKQPTTSLLYGLCDIWTGTPPTLPTEYTQRNEAQTTLINAFVSSWGGAKVPP